MQHPHRLLVLLTLVACSSSSSSSAPTAPPPAPPTAPPVAWAPCPLHSEGTGPTAECATIDVPLGRDQPNGETLPFFVKRWHPDGGSKARALWMLQGGPGASGYAFEALAETLATKWPDVEFYIPDHRGTGKSARIGCPAEDDGTDGGRTITAAEWPGCLDAVKAALGPKLAAYTTTNAANDVAVAIARTRTDGQPVFVYGASYGTFWAHRIMQLAPTVADGFVLDSIVPPVSSLARQDQDAGEAGKDFFAACAADAECAAHLGADPWAKAQGLVAKLKSGFCPGLEIPAPYAPHVFFRLLFGSLLMDPGGRSLLPRIVERADRCDASDVTALNKLLTSPGQQPPEEFFRQWGFVLSNNVALSELWEDPSPSAADLAAWREQLTVSREVTTGFDPVVGIWPTYPKDAFFGGFAGTDVPVLMLQGGLDPATLLRKALVMKDRLNGPHQHWVEVPTATHGVIGSSPTKEGRSCGTRILMSFLANPKGDPDTSCLADLAPLTFDFTSL